MTFHGKQVFSRLDADGTLTVELVDQAIPDPTGANVVIKVEAAPINPSDLGLMFGHADLAKASFSPGKLVARMPDAAVRIQSARHGIPQRVGNEGAGVVVAAGDDPLAQALLGRRVSCVPGGMYATYAAGDARACMVLDDGVDAAAGASSFVNPVTALAFLETMKAEGHRAIIHTAAASNLGQMLVRLSHEDGFGLVNVVRSEAQATTLRALGAQHVLDSSLPDFDEQLVDAIDRTGAMLAFDAIGGGTMAGRLLSAMERVASRGQPFSVYGSMTPKKVYIYGMLDASPTIINRDFGFSWDVAGWLLTPHLAKMAPETVGAMRQRVMAGLTTTFASSYKGRIALEDMLSPEAVRAYAAIRTGEKYLVVPGG